MTRLNSVNLAPDGNLWVLNGPKGQFQNSLSPDGAFIEAWGSPGTGEGEFDFVRPDGLSYGDVAFAPDGGFYVVESGNQRVQRFDADRQFVTMWGSKGEVDGQFMGTSSARQWHPTATSTSSMTGATSSRSSTPTARSCSPSATKPGSRTAERHRRHRHRPRRHRLRG